METILAFSFMDYLLTSILVCMVLLVMSYCIGLIFKYRVEIKMMQERSDLKHKYKTEIKSLRDEIANAKYKYHIKFNLYVDLLQFLGAANMKVNITVLKQKVRTVELIANEEVMSILSGYIAQHDNIPSEISQLKIAMQDDLNF